MKPALPDVMFGSASPICWQVIAVPSASPHSSPPSSSVLSAFFTDSACPVFFRTPSAISAVANSTTKAMAKRAQLNVNGPTCSAASSCAMKDMPNMNAVRARNMAFFGFITFSVCHYTPFACACQCGAFAEIRQNAPHAAFSLVLLLGMWYNGRDNAQGKRH